MTIVLIHWKIRPEQEMVDAFLNYWKTTLTVKDRTGLIGEFLAEPGSKDEYSWITWSLAGCEGQYRSFVTVGCWSSADEFHAQIKNYFETKVGAQEFEFAPRVRTIMNSLYCRIGNGRLPVHDSDGVM